MKQFNLTLHQIQPTFVRPVIDWGKNGLIDPDGLIGCSQTG